MTVAPNSRAAAPAPVGDFTHERHAFVRRAQRCGRFIRSCARLLVRMLDARDGPRSLPSGWDLRVGGSIRTRIQRAGSVGQSNPEWTSYVVSDTRLKARVNLNLHI